MKQRPAIFKVVVSGDGKSLESSNLEKFLEKNCLPDEELEVIVIQPRRICEVIYSDKEVAPEGLRACPCGKTMLSRGEKCKECGGGYQTHGEPFKNIRKEFPNMRVLP